VDDVEIPRRCGDRLEQRSIGGCRMIRTREALPQGLRPSPNEVAFGARLPAGKHVTSWPSPTSSAASHDTTRSVPP
jgi:hypothetical protein